MKYGRKVTVSVFFLTLLVMVSGCRGKGNSAENAAERKTVTGYSNQRYFARCFKKYFNVTPTEYREKSL